MLEMGRFLLSNKLKLIHLFSGVGSPEMALKRLGIPFEIVGYSEIDKYAIQSYKAIHGDVPFLGDVTQIERLPKCNMLFFGFCCQDISVAGKQKGLLDELGNKTRSGLLFDVLRLIKLAKDNDESPEILIAENVKNLVGKKFKNDFDNLLLVLDSLGYNSYWQVLNAKDYEVPQNRERVFIVSIRKDVDKRGYTFPEKMQLKKCIKDILEENPDPKLYLSDDKVERFIKTSNNTKARNTDTICLGNASIDTNSQAGKCYSTDGLSPTLCAGTHGYAMGNIIEYQIGASRGRNPENPSDRTIGAPTEQRLEITSQGISKIIDDTYANRKPREYDIPQIRIRKLSPRECWRLMDFSDEDFDKAKAVGISNTQLYKIVGNSIVVACLYHIFRKLFIDFNEVKKDEIQKL